MFCLISTNAGEGTWWRLTPQGTFLQPVITREIEGRQRMTMREFINLTPYYGRE